MPPAPKDSAARRRRNKTLPMTRLPAEGRKGRTPKWPLAEQSDEEAQVWRSVWRLPQAVVWEQQHLHRVVARYCRLLVRAEEPDAPVMLSSEVRQLEDRLLMSPERLKRAYYEISTDEVAQVREERAPEQPKKRRLMAVDTG